MMLKYEKGLFTKTADVAVVEVEVTAPEKNAMKGWPTAHLHNKWPGVRHSTRSLFVCGLSWLK